MLDRHDVGMEFCDFEGIAEVFPGVEESVSQVVSLKATADTKIPMGHQVRTGVN